MLKQIITWTSKLLPVQRRSQKFKANVDDKANEDYDGDNNDDDDDDARDDDEE